MKNEAAFFSFLAGFLLLYGRRYPNMPESGRRLSLVAGIAAVIFGVLILLGF